MFKKSLLLTLLMALLVPWAANAQTTVTIGDLSEATNDSYLPMNSLYEYSYTQQIYTADEIGMAGTINSITVWLYGNANLYEMPFDIYMVETDKESFESTTDWVAVTSGDIVYSGSVTVHNTDAEAYTFELETPFSYSGSGNLVIAFDNNTGQWKSGLNGKVFTATDNVNRALYARRDSNDYDPTNMSGVTASGNVAKRNVIEIDITPSGAAICYKPTNVTVSDVTAHTATVSWTSDAESFNLMLGDDVVENVSNPYTLTGLTPETAYTVKVKAICGGESGESDWTNGTNFTTEIACPAPTALEVTPNALTATFTWESDASSWDVTYGTDATADPNQCMSTIVEEATYTVNDLELGDYYFWVRSNCGSEGYSQWAGPVSVHIGYCVPNPTSHDGSGITGVSFGTGDYVVTNGDGSASLPASAPYYGDYSSMIGAVQAGVESTIAITTSTGSWPYTFVIWVDFDNSLSFEDSEVVYVGKASSGSGTLNATITIPATQELGDYRMRIYGADSYFTSFYGNGTTNWEAAHDPCSSGTYRHAHDYTLRVLEAPSCLTPTGLTASDVTAHEATISWTSDASAWEIQLDEEEAIEVTEATYTFTGLTAETEYSVKVRTNCSGTYSDWTNAITFTTGIACPAPTGLAATLTPGDGTVATFSWTENGSATAWQLCINGDEDNLIDMDENPYTYNGFTPEETYTAKVRAVCGGIDGESQWSSTVTFTPTNAYMLTVNDGTNTHSYVPFYGYYADSDANSQFIIPASALSSMQWGTINKITFYGGTASATWTGAVFDIYFSEVSNTEFESAALVDWSDLNSKVYTGSVSVVDNKMELTLTAPYQYMGGNLLIGFDETTNSSNYPQMSWYGVTQTTNTAVYKYSTNAAVLVKFLPKVTFAYVPGEEPSCFKPNNLAVNYEGGTTAIVTWEGETETYNIDVNGEVTEGVTSPYTLEDLELATTYAVMVQANCGSDLSEWTNPVSFTTDLCLPENMCEITIELTDAYGDGGGQIQVVDALTEEVLGTYTNSSASTSYTLAVCDGRELNFVFASTDNWAYENGYVITDVNGEVIAEHVGCSSSGSCEAPTNGVVATYTVSCTVNPCRVPTDLATSEISTFKADLSWTGYHDAYNLQYRRPAAADPTATTATVILTAGDVWGDGSGYQMLLDADATAYGTIIPETVSGYGYISTDGTIGGSTGDVASSVYDEFEYKIPVNADGALATENIVINDTITIEIPAGTYDWCITNPTFGDRMWIASSNGNVGGRYDDFVFEAGMTYEFAVSMHGENDGVDVTITPMDEWILVENLTDPSYELTGLDAKTMYEWQVQGISDDCENGVTEWSAISSFFTEKAYYWNDPQTWTNDSVPAAYEDVTIPANTTVIIPDGYIAIADEITIEEGGQIIIEQGGQLFHSNEIPVTVQMQNTGYSETKDNVGGFHLIASPVSPSVEISTTGLVSDEFIYDLYYFDQAGDEEGNEWINYNQGEGNAPGFTELYIQKGYLYASENTIQAEFVGSTLPTNAPVSVALDYVAGKRLAGWNLVGNPFTCMAYIDKPFYALDPTGSVLASIEGNSIEVMEGIFVKVDSLDLNPTVTFSTVDGGEYEPIGAGADPNGEDKGNLVLNLSHNNALIDRAIVRFDEGRQLPKLQLNPNSTEVYIPMDGVDYAIVNATEMGEIPVSFKAERNDTYTMSFSSENVAFNYLHLIDNMTGADVDLLVKPSYSFEATTSDYASRFKLVFATGNNSNDDNFAFYSNGNFVINNDGEATLQVVDVMGHILSSKTINGSASVNVNAASGVYMLRLINGNNVKVQKVLVK